MLVSVVIPTYNRATTISRAIQSVLDQTYRDLEVIVVDDGSTDSTQEILRGFDGRIKVIRQANAGPSSARNCGIKAARGDIVAFLDSDDVWLPSKLERQVEMLMREGRGMPCCVCNATLSGTRHEGRTSFDEADIKGRFEAGVWLNVTHVLATRFLLFNQVTAVRREALQVTGGFREDLWLLEDYDMALRLSLLGPWGIINEPLVITHEGAGNRLSDKAYKDPLALLDAKQKILQTLVLRNQTTDKKLQRSLNRALKDTGSEILANKLAARPSALISGLGRLCLFAIRQRYAIWRRTPLWPQVKVLPA